MKRRLDFWIVCIWVWLLFVYVITKTALTNQHAGLHKKKCMWHGLLHFILVGDIAQRLKRSLHHCINIYNLLHFLIATATSPSECLTMATLWTPNTYSMVSVRRRSPCINCILMTSSLDRLQRHCRYRCATPSLVHGMCHIQSTTLRHAHLIDQVIDCHASSYTCDCMY